MKLEVTDHIASVFENQTSTIDFFKTFENIYPKIQSKNIIVTLSDFQMSASDFIENIIDIFRDEVTFLDKDRLLHDDIEDAIIFLQNLSVDFEIL